MEALSGFKSLQDSISQSLVAVTRTANQIASEDLGFYRSLNPAVATALDQHNARLLGLAERLLGNAAANSEVVGPRLPDFDAVDSNWKGIVDVIDSLLEKADTSLDEYTGAVKRLSPSRESVRSGEAGAREPSDRRQTPTRTVKPPQKIANALRYATIDKPQLSFQHVPTNAEKEPFKPLLQEKPNSATSLDDTLRLTDAEDGTPQYPHPYRTEIENYQYPPYVYAQAEPQPYLPFDSTMATFVDTEEAMEEMLKELKNAKEIAIDLEHHDFRSYIGLVSLMQISTRDKDWVVDTLKPWRRKLQCLNQVFTDPNILKVFHGAHMDIIWLQRDLGLYIVGLFDTHFASRALGYAGGSLAFLLKKFVNFDAQKQYQTADWRIRPLPQEFFDYARSDTHFLLYIYDNMRNELVQKSDFSQPNNEKDKVNDVLIRSKEVSLQTYRHPIYDSQRGLGPTGWYKMLNRTPASLSRQQFAVFRAVHEWRDNVAREQDDSLFYVLPNHAIFTVAKEMPVDKVILFSLVQPITQTIKLRADELLSVIQRARETGQEAPDMLQVMNGIDQHLYEKYGDYIPRNTASAAKPTIQAAPIMFKQTTLPKQLDANSQSLRSTKSSFFGSISDALFGGGGAKRELSTMAASQISLQVPLPPLTAEIFADPFTISTPSTPAPAVPSPAPKAPVDDLDSANEVFTLKERSRKRKSDALAETTDDQDLAGQADEVDISGSGLTPKQIRKAAKRAKKQAERSANGNMPQPLANEAGKEEEEEEFDYSTAPSVLNARAARAAEDVGRGRRGKKDKDDSKNGNKAKEAFNPFAKAMDTSKGLARAQKERAGKSMTFRK